MDQKQIDIVKKQLDEINKTITTLDPAIRVAAFNILSPLYFEEHVKGTKDDSHDGKKKLVVKKQNSNETIDGLEEFFGQHEHKKPADNVVLIAAWLYSQHGVISINAKTCRDISEQVGFTIPNRPDNTMRQATEKGKKLFRQQGAGWILTTHGELYVKEKYQVRKGNKPVSEGENK
jgi:hypothetical protein